MPRPFTFCAIAMTAALVLGVMNAPAQTVIYVDASAAGANDGSSWSDAFIDLQDALARAQNGDEIWVAAGLYKPGTTDDLPHATFKVPPGAAMYGGFAGWETRLDQRDWKSNETVLTGQIGSGSFRANTVVTAPLPTPGTVIDGFTIERGGFFQDTHGAVYQFGGQLALANCRIILSSPGINVDGGNLHIHDCVFQHNQGPVTKSGGGAMRAVDSVLTIEDCDFRDNAASAGGALWLGSCDTLVRRSTFQYNWGEFSGSAIRWAWGSLEIRDSTLRDNAGSMSMYGTGAASFTMDDSVVQDNSGGISVRPGHILTITGSTFINNANTSEPGGAVFVWGPSDVTIDNCHFENNLSLQWGGGVALLNADPAIVRDSDFRSNVAGGPSPGGGLAVVGDGQVRVVNCIFENNGGGAGILADQGGSVEIVSSFLAGNIPYAVDARSGGSAMIMNSLLTANVGGGIRAGHELGGEATVEIINSTIIDSIINAPELQAGVTVFPDSHAVVRNSILWNNGSGVESDQIMGPAEVSHSIVQGFQPGGMYSGPGVIGDDPLFADEDGRLSANSPAIDAGDNALLPPEIVEDLDGNPRFVDGDCDGSATVDMGAFEYQVKAGDLNCDGVVDVSDLFILLGAWGPCPESGNGTGWGAHPPAEPGANGDRREGQPQCIGDLNGDGVVDVGDLLILLGNWG